MRVLTVRDGDTLRAAILNDQDEVVLLDANEFPSVLALVEAGPAVWPRLADFANGTLAGTFDEANLAPPIGRPPRNMFCVGINYRSHWDEGDRGGAAAPQAPVFFTKPWTCLVPHGATVQIDPIATRKADWEAEIAIVVGKGGRNIPLEQGLDHVFGFVLANDLSARDLQLGSGPTSQWFKGKSLDGFCPMGPYIVTRDAVADTESIDVALRVNGELKQDFSTKQMIHSFSSIIAHLSLGMALLPGDVILTGTSSGVGHWQKPPQFLGDGDVVEMTSSVLGSLSFQTALMR
ncbi:MAG: fumarylacetoacetate hydrolase family protein [Ilumatobacteraceae bacterium]